MVPIELARVLEYLLVDRELGQDLSLKENPMLVSDLHRISSYQKPGDDGSGRQHTSYGEPSRSITGTLSVSHRLTSTRPCTISTDRRCCVHGTVSWNGLQVNELVPRCYSR